MRLCRFDDDRLGLVRGDEVIDVSAVAAKLPAQRWPLPLGDQLIANLDRLRPEIERAAHGKTGKKLSQVKLLSPVANPSKIIGAPVNYLKHMEESKVDPGISQGREVVSIESYGLFLKSASALVGPSQGCALRFADRRNDHEVELAVVIGKKCTDVPADRALDMVAGYAIGLDMTVRGKEDRSLRKSVDSYAVLGPWLVTADEIEDPDNLDLKISVGGEMRQNSNTRMMIFGTRKLIEYATRFYTLYPGDIIMTGTPEGVSPVEAGDVMHAEIEGIGAMDVAVRAH